MNYPESIQRVLEGYVTSGENYRTSSEAEIYLFQKKGAPNLFFKIGSGDVDAPLVNEKNAMDWLDGVLQVPRVVAYDKVENKEYLITERILGLSSHELRVDKALTVRILAEGLRAIHAVDIDGCPFPDCCADALILNAEHNIAEGIVTAELLAEYNDSRTLDEALAEARSLTPKCEALVLTHGDYCLPNIMIDKGKLSGFIDWGSVGIGGRHRDFVAVEFSVRRNLGDEWVEPFFDAYGRDDYDEDVMAFYYAIDALV